MIDGKKESTWSQCLETRVQNNTRIGKVVEHLKEADHVELRVLKKARAHDVTNNSLAHRWRRLRNRRSARLDPADGSKTLGKRFLEKETVAATYLEQGVFADAITFEADEASAISTSEV
jgi:hypothetical protein